MVVFTVAKRDLPLLQFFTALPVKLQTSVTGSTGVVSEDFTHVVQHMNHTGGNGFGWRGTVLRCWWSAFKCSLLRLVVATEGVQASA